MHDLHPTAVRQRSASLFARAGYVLGLTLLTTLVCCFVPAPKAGGLAGVILQSRDGVEQEPSLPNEIGELYGHDQAVSAAELYILPKDTTFARKTYGLPGVDDPDRILCSIILSGAERRSIHRPERCLPSQGWRIDSRHTETIPLASGRTLGVTALLLEKPALLPDGTRLNRREYFLYWFVGKGFTTPSNNVRILWTYWDMLVHRTNQRWAYVIVAKEIPPDFVTGGETPEQTLAELKQFIHDAVPCFMKSEMPPGTSSTN